MLRDVLFRLRDQWPWSLGVPAVVLGCLFGSMRGTQSVDAESPHPASSRIPQTKAASLDGAAIRLSDLNDKPHTLSAEKHPRGCGLVFLSTECPIARRSLPEIGRLQKQFRKQGLPVYGVISDRSVTRAAAKKWRAEFKIDFPVLFDASGELAAALRPTHTPEAFVLDAHTRVAYRGRIDDFFKSVGRARQNVTNREFHDALQAVAAGRRPAVRYRKPVGCPVENVEPASAGGKVTYCRDVAPILYRNCVTCHRPGEVAPFSLTKYADAAKRAGWLSKVTKTGLMPPWNAKRGFGHFQDERLLTKAEIATLAAWAEAGAPQGDVSDLPERPKFTTGWALGKPDMVIRMPKPVQVPAGGADLFRFISIPLDLPEDRHVAAIDFRPGNPLVVHHAIVAVAPQAFIKNFGASAEMPAFDPVRDGLPRIVKLIRQARSGNQNLNFGLLGAWVPGMRPYRHPAGHGIPLKKDATLLLQMHYAPSGKPETDQSEVALYFCKKPVKRTVGGVALNKMNLNIPAGASKHRVETSLTLPVDVTLLGIAPHMHLLGREMKVTATRPDGTTEKLIWVDDWNWNWQGQFRYAKPIRLPKGTRVDLKAVYDNSAKNPANPHSPPKNVRFGRKTTDEMCICFLQLAFDRPADQQAVRRAALKNVLSQFGGRFRGLLRLMD